MRLSHRYIPGAPAARQGGEPARHRVRARRGQPARDAARGRGLRGGASRRSRPSCEIIGREEAIGIDRRARRTRVDAALEQEHARLAELEARWSDEKALVDGSSSCARSCARQRAGRRARRPALRRAPRHGAATRRRKPPEAPRRRPPPLTPRRAREAAAPSCASSRRSSPRCRASAADPAERRRAGRRRGRRGLDRHPGRPHGEERDRGAC